MDARELVTEIERTLASRGLAAGNIEVLSPPEARKRGRASLCVDLIDGRRVKVRVFESGEAARQSFEVRANLESAFAPPLERMGRALVEEWIEGCALDDDAPGGWAEPAGRLLARLHLGPVPEAATRDVGRGSIGSSDRPREDLAALVDARRVATDTAARLAAELEALDPGGSAPVLIHRDFCGENMVIDRAGCLRVIDNEWFAAGPAGFDLGRAYCRWPISQPAWERFLGGYRALAPIEPSVLRFWQLAVAIWSARIRLTAGERRLTASLDVVRRLAAPGR